LSSRPRRQGRVPSAFISTLDGAGVCISWLLAERGGIRDSVPFFLPFLGGSRVFTFDFAAPRKSCDPFDFRKRSWLFDANVAMQQDGDFMGFYAIS
jgi:hypothetical protein